MIAMIHKTAYILAYDMLRKKSVHDWVERRAVGIIGLPYGSGRHCHALYINPR